MTTRRPVSTVAVTVVDIAGHCSAGHQVGDEIIFDGQKVEGEICIDAMSSLMDKVMALRYGAEFPWSDDKDADRHVCPDPLNAVVFEIRRVRG